MERQNKGYILKSLYYLLYLPKTLVRIYAEDMVSLLGKQLGDLEACPLHSPHSFEI